MMNRKRFLWYSLTGVAVFYFPCTGCKGPSSSRVLTQPQLLSHFCDEKTLREIGEMYRKGSPRENDEGQLRQLLLTDPQGKALPEGNDDLLRKAIEERITADFKSGDTTVLKGWVISRTEARQCALHSFNSY